ncbi:MAG: bacillithiol biosynthesis cysteine-adding enzyme BshC [Bacteroidota bacterium]
MFKTTFLDFKNSGTLNPLVLDYLEKNDKVRPFYNFFPDLEGFSNLLKNKPYTNFDRLTLSDILLKQSAEVKNTSEPSLANIALIKNKNVFTITTGHQLCLFTGPLYFIYKIFSAINLAENLKKEFPDFDFVPVYWMASEDHDFEEISNFTSKGKTVIWESEQKGAVGDFKTAELKKILPQLREALGISENANYLFTLFENAYLKHTTLAQATRFLVNELFGRYGLVTVDGNDERFKNQIKKLFEKDIFENYPATAVNTSIKKLEGEGYPAQVNPRDINCFFIENNLRARIEKSGESYNLVGTDRSFSKQELEQIIEKKPGSLSPNVVLRPVYQQIILPNIAYVGGPGELAYWLEFKDMFTGLDVLFPVLMARSFLTLIDKNVQHKIEQLKFSGSDFFKPEQELIRDFMVKNNHVFDLNAEKEKIRAVYANLTERAAAVDKTLSGHIAAELQKTLNKLDRISGKTNKALKRKSETDLNRISAVKQVLFPRNVPQERLENFSTFYIEYGPAFFDALKKEINPLELSHKILTGK